MTTIPTMTMKKNTDHAIVMPAPPPHPPPPTPHHHHHHHHRVSSSSSSAVGVGVGSVGVVGVGVLPTIRGWTHDGLEGTVSGFMSGSRIFPDGSPVTTSRLIVDPGVALSAGCIVQTKSGSRYVLGDEARKGGGAHHRHHPRGAPPSSSTAATPWSMSSPMRRRLWRLSRPIASHLRSIGGTIASRLSSLDPVSRRALRLAAASLYVLVAIAVFRATHHPSGRHRHGGGDDGGGDDGPPLIGISPDRDKCQIVYVIGVEGSIHHGVTPILRSLAGHQVDRETGLRYEVSYADRELRSAIFGFNRNARSIDNPTMVRSPPRKKKEICVPSRPFADEDDVRDLGEERPPTDLLSLFHHRTCVFSHRRFSSTTYPPIPSPPPLPLFAFGHHLHPPPPFSPETNARQVRHTMRQICPGSSATNDGGDGGGSAGPRRRRVILEDLSFPSGTVDDPRTYRIHRQRWWYGSTMEQIAMSETAMNHPTNLHAFYEAYSVSDEGFFRYVDILMFIIYIFEMDGGGERNDTRDLLALLPLSSETSAFVCL
jgi:hypothetical protein